jgi:hypothetical protein
MIEGTGNFKAEIALSGGGVWVDADGRAERAGAVLRHAKAARIFAGKIV